MAETAPPLAKSARKPKPKVRALEEHKPALHIDLRRAEELFKEFSDLNDKAFWVLKAFLDLVRTPLACGAHANGVDADMKALLDALRGNMSAVRLSPQNEVEGLMTAALAGLRVLRATRRMSEEHGQEPHHG